MNEFPAISELVPHAAPIVALDRLVEWQPGLAVAEATVRGEDPFARDGGVDSVVLLEWMAQAVAACLGMEAWTGGDDVRVGMVIACRELELARGSVRVGERLVLEARRVRGTDEVSSFETMARDGGGEMVGRAVMTLVHGVG